MWRFYNRFDFLNIYITSHPGGGTYIETTVRKESKTPARTRCCDGGRVNRQFTEPRTTPFDPAHNTATQRHRSHPHTFTLMLLVCLSVFCAYPEHPLYTTWCSRFNFISPAHTRYQGNNNSCNNWPFLNRQSVMEFGFTLNAHVHSCVCVYYSSKLWTLWGIFDRLLEPETPDVKLNSGFV